MKDLLLKILSKDVGLFNKCYHFKYLHIEAFIFLQSFITKNTKTDFQRDNLVYYKAKLCLF